MLSKSEFLDQIAGTIGKTKVIELSRILHAQNFALHDLVDLTFYEDKNIAFRAAWVLENLFLKNPELYLTEIDYLLLHIKEVKHESCQRHYAKILMHLTSAKANRAIRLKMETTNLESVVEQCFDWLIDPKIKIAVKNFAASTLFNLKERYPWINEELKSQMLFLMRNGSPGIQARGRKIVPPAP